MRTWQGVIAVLAVVAAGAQEADIVIDEEDGAALESAIADRPALQRWSLRWRVRGAEWGAERLQVYQRLEWALEEGREVYLLAERDPGERRWNDHTAFYLQWRTGEAPVDLVVGDLLPGWGAGLVCGRGGSRGSLPLAPSRGDRERVGYRSSGENRALRGVALRYAKEGLAMTAIGGRAWRDARLDESGKVISLPEDGYHVTAGEEAGRRLLAMEVAGGRVRYRRGGWDGGASLLVVGFAHPLDLRRPERKPWAFRGKGQQLLGLDGGWRAGRLEIQGEAARDREGRWGIVGGVRIDLERLRLRGGVRRYDPGFYSPFGGAPSRGGMENERGIGLTLEGKGGGLRWQLFGDRYRRPERSYYYPLPATIEALGARLERRLGRMWRGRLQLRVDQRPYWREGRSVDQASQRLRGEVEYGRGRGSVARLRLKAEGRRLTGRGEGAEYGWALGALYRGKWKRGHVDLQATRFQTGSYYTRLYEYEYGLPGTVNIRPLYGSGWRGNLLVGWNWRGVAVNGRYRLQRDLRIRQYGGVQIDVGKGRR